ncbi:MAG TPA: hypothetical protein P5048_00510 [Chlamydiales bacterium]|nr:hypothetical protein [Chlamydiales bacterium]
MEEKYASIVLESNIDKPLDYLIPEELHPDISIGSLVEIPLKNYFKKGYVIGLKKQPGYPNPLPIHKLLSPSILTKDLYELALWMSEYYVCSLSKVFKAMIPSSIREDIKQKTQQFISLNITKKNALLITQQLISKNPKQASILEILLKEKKGLFLTDLFFLLEEFLKSKLV